MKVQKDSRQILDAASRNMGRTLAMCAIAVGSLTMSPYALASESLGEVETSVNQTVTQNSYVKGTVVDENGDPMVGVTVLADGKAGIGTATDIDGNFSLKVKPGTELTFSYIGYNNVKAKAANGMKISMESTSVALDEVVAIGYGTIKKRDLTGAVSSVKSEDIVRVPTGNVMEALQGKVAGLDITRSTGEAGDGVSINLRGIRSFNGSNDPLFIIDGMEGSYDELNPNDIESVEVLKGASATAIYGSAGANGVIIITTKSPEKGRFQINFDGYYGWNKVSSFPKMRTGESYIEMRRQAMRTAGLWNGPEDDSSLFPVYVQNYIDQDKWVNWFDEGTQTGQTQSYNINTNYSNDRVDAMFSLNYYDIQGILKDDEYKRYSIRTKLDFHANPYVNYGVNLYAMYINNDKRPSRIWNRLICMAPYGDPYLEDGSINPNPVEGANEINPLADTQTGVYALNRKTISFTPQAYVELVPVKGLSIKSVLGGYFRSRKVASYTGDGSYAEQEYGQTKASIDNTLNYNYKWQNIITYNFKLKDIHDFTVTGVTEWSKNRTEVNGEVANGFDSNDYAYHNLAASTGTPTVSSSYVQTQMMSYAFRINYSFMGRYLASVTSRWDGASMLADGNKWDVFPAASLGWRISDEPFLRDVQWLNNLKLRAEYGVTGNAGASAYATMDYSQNGIVGFQDVAQSYSGFTTSIANPNLGWEKSYNWNVGIDMGFLNDRINATLDWYRTDTKDLLYQKKLPWAAGGAATGSDHSIAQLNIWDNIGETRNTGIELAITSRNIVNKDFQWTTTLTFSTNHNEVIKTISDAPIAFGDYYLIPGEAVRTYYGYKYGGIWSTNQADEAAKYGQKPGQVHILEKGETNYTLNDDDYYVLGSADPKWSGSLLNNFYYKGFDLSILLLTRWDWTMPYGVTGWYRADGISASPEICDYWTPENQSARYPRPDANNSKDDYLDACNYFDASYLKVKNITLGYTIPKNVLGKFGIDKARVYFTAENPFIWTKSKYLKNYDPEKGGDDDNAPLTKQYVIGVNLTF